MTGTTIAQAIPIAISPILTRIYTPNDFGMFALYMSIAGILSAVSTGRYELAITLPKEDSDAINIVALSIIISFIISVIIFFVIFIFNEKISSLFSTANNLSKWLYFIPISVIFTSLLQSFKFWQNRKKEYKTMSKSRVIQSAMTGGLNINIGTLIVGSAGLVAGNIIGLISATFYMIFKVYVQDKQRIKKDIKVKRIIAVAKRYKKFPKFDIFASLCNISSHQSTHIFFNVFFGASSSGHFYLTQKIFGLPIQLIASSIQDVFRQKMTALHNEKGNTRKLFNAVFKKLFFLALLPTACIYIYSIDIFVFFFGRNWLAAGEFVRILTPVFFLRFISFPLSSMFYIAEKQNYNTVGQFLLLIITISSFLIGKNHSAIYTVELLSISLSIFYLIYICLAFKFTSKGINKLR